jgi:hypothetical protein
MKVEKHGMGIARAKKKEQAVPYNISMFVCWFRGLR